MGLHDFKQLRLCHFPSLIPWLLDNASTPNQDGLMVSVIASHAVGHGFASRLGHIENHHKNGTNCLHASHAGVRVGIWQCSQTI